MKPATATLLKAFLKMMLLIFCLLMIWLVFVFVGHYYFQSKASGGQFLLWLVSGVIIFIIYPLFSKMYLSKWLSKKTGWRAVTDVLPFNKSDWIFFIILHLAVMPVLFWIFSDLQTHADIYNFFVDHFGKTSRGAPRFPIMILFMAVPLIFFSMFYLLVLKIKYGTFNEPKFENNDRDNNFRQKRKIYQAYVFSTSFTIMFCYICKWILMV